jgi:hypothetical protein
LCGALSAVGDRELCLQALVLLAQALVLRGQRLKALAQRSLGGALPGGNAIGPSGCAVAQPLDLRAQRALIDRLARRIEDAVVPPAPRDAA